MTLLLIVATCICTCYAQIAQKKSAAVLNETQSFLKTFLNLWMLSAYAALALGLIIWLNVLQQASVGVTYPMLSLNVVFITLAGKYFFQEKVSKIHWIGIFFIFFGIYLLSQ